MRRWRAAKPRKSLLLRQKKAHICLPRQCVLFSTKFALQASEIASLWNICFANVKYSLTRMWANFISHCDEGAIFHNSRSELFHIRRKPNISLKAYDSEVFRNFVDAFPRGGLLAHHFGSHDRFEPAKCIFWYRFPTESKPWTDSNRHTVNKASKKCRCSRIVYKSTDAKALCIDSDLRNGWKIQIFMI